MKPAPSPSLHTIGNSELLTVKGLGLFCSVKCPASIILKTYDLAQQLKNNRISVISGFHSPIENEVLLTLLRGDQPIILCPARSIEKMRVPAAYNAHIANGRLLIASPFSERDNRITEKTAQVRNRFVATLAKWVLVAYAAPESKTEAFCRELAAARKPLLTFESDHTENLMAMGAMPIDVSTII